MKRMSHNFVFIPSFQSVPSYSWLGQESHVNNLLFVFWCIRPARHTLPQSSLYLWYRVTICLQSGIKMIKPLAIPRLIYAYTRSPSVTTKASVCLEWWLEFQITINVRQIPLNCLAKDTLSALIRITTSKNGSLPSAPFSIVNWIPLTFRWCKNDYTSPPRNSRQGRCPLTTMSGPTLLGI